MQSRWWHALAAAGPWVLLACAFPVGLACAQPPGIVVLKDGTRLGPGILGEKATISKNSAAQGQAQTIANSIISVDDDLRVTFVNRSRVDPRNVVPAVNALTEEIELPSKGEVARGAGILSIQSVVKVTEFSQNGRRTYSVSTPKGVQNIFQGITKLTPLYAQVQTLRDGGNGAVPWDQRIATASIPPDKLSEILRHEMSLDRASEWMRMYRFYLQAERYTEARRVLLEALEKFPELEPQRALLVGLNQALAGQMFREIELRRRSGQSQLASRLLQDFPVDMGGEGAVTETQLRVQEQLEELKGTVTQIAEIVQTLKAQLTELPPADAELLRPIVEQISTEISMESQGRLSDYARFSGEKSMSLDQRLSFAIGGWLLGSGVGLDNFEVAKSLVRVSALVREYLAGATAARREEILELLAKEEGGQPETVGRLIAAMKPPLPLPQSQSEDPPGLLRLSVPPLNTASGEAVQYTVQLPPEYDPYRRYPCIVALPGLGAQTDMEINWWCGAYNAEIQQRLGTATRYGYIVLSPKWMSSDQMQYHYSEAEHERVLRCLRDAFRRCSIDTDRVFISGHFDGATAAWDIALSHPDLWAGTILLSPSAEKFILLYGINAAYVPTYTVWGEFDGSKLMENLGRTVDDYLHSQIFDAIGVEYKGRPRDHFLEEVPRIIEWMELTSHRRDPNPRQLALHAGRRGDRFFYWFEMPEIDPKNVVSPVMFEMKRNKVDVSLQPNGTTIKLSKFPSRQAWVWLRPGMVNFGQIVEVIGKGNSKVTRTFKGDNRILLEDVRMRADRQAPFYDRIEAQ